MGFFNNLVGIVSDVQEEEQKKKTASGLMRGAITGASIATKNIETPSTKTSGMPLSASRSEELRRSVDSFFKDTPVVQKVAWDAAYKATEPVDVSTMQDTFTGSLAYPFAHANEKMKASLRSHMDALSQYKEAVDEGKNTVVVDGIERNVQWEMVKHSISPMFTPFEGALALSPTTEVVGEKVFEFIGDRAQDLQRRYVETQKIRDAQYIRMMSQPGYYLDPVNPEHDTRLKEVEEKREQATILNTTAIDIASNALILYGMGKAGKKIGEKFKLKENEIRQSDMATQVKDVALWELQKLKEKIRYEEKFEYKPDIEAAIAEGRELFQKQRRGQPVPEPTRLQVVISRVKNQLKEGERLKLEVIDGKEGLILRTSKRNFVEWAKNFIKDWFPKEARTEQMKQLMAVKKEADINTSYELANIALNWGIKENRLAGLSDPLVPGARPGVEKAAPLPVKPEEQALITEAKKYKSADEFVEAQQPEKVTFKSALEKKDYMGGHEAPMAEDINAPIWDLTGKYTGNELYPKDIYSSDASRMYSSGMDYDPQAISILHSVKNKPNARVTIYRAVSKDVKGEVNPGDWVTLTREYAKDHGESNLGDNYKIVKREVRARDIFTDANSIQEFGYDPQPKLAPKDTPYDLLSKAYKEGKTDIHSQYQRQLTDIWNKAQLPEGRLQEGLAYMRGAEGKPSERPGIEKPVPVIEDMDLKTARELEKKTGELADVGAKIEAVDERLKGFDREDLNAIRKLSRIMEKSDGDIETLRKIPESPVGKGYPEKVEKKIEKEIKEKEKLRDFTNVTIERIEEVLGLEESEAIRFIEEVPTREQVAALKSERRLTSIEANKLYKRIERMQTIRNIKDKQEAAQKIKSDIIQYAKAIPLRERGKLLATIKNAKTKKDYKKAVKQVERLQEFAEKKSLTKSIEKELKLLKPKKKKGIVKGKITAKTQALINEIGKRLSGNKAEAEVQLEKNINEYANKPVPKEVVVENKLLEMTGMKDMDSSELRNVLKLIRQIKDKGELAVSLKRANEEARLERVKDSAVDEFTGKEGLKYGEEVGVKTEKVFNPVSRVVDTMNNAMLGYRDVLEKMSKGVKTSAVKNWTTKQVHEARKKNTKLTREWRTDRKVKYAELMNVETNRQLKKKLVEQGKEKVVFKGEDSKGHQVELEYSELEAADLYMKLQDPTLAKTFEKTMRYSPEMYKAIDKAVSPELKAYADWLIEEHYPVVRKEMAPVYEGKYGVKMPVNPSYSPLKRFGVDIAEDTDLLTGDIFPGKPTTTPASAKSRTGSRLPIEATDIMKVAARHELQVAQFVSFDKAVSNLRRVFGDKEVKSAIKQYHGGNILNRLNKVIDDIARGSVDSRLTVQAIDKQVARFTKASLMLNFVPMVKQLTSFPAFVAQMPFKDFVIGGAEFGRAPVKWTKKLMQSETLYDRVTRGFDKETALALKSGREKIRIGDNKLSTKEFIMNSLVMPTRGGDMIPILPGATAKYIQATKQGKSPEEALVEAELMVLETQQSPHIEDLSHFQTSGSFLKLMSMYQTTPIQYYRKSIEAVRNARYGRSTKKDAAKKVFIYWVLLPSLFQFVASGLRWDDENQLRAIMFGPLNYYPAVGNLLQTVYGVSQGEWWRDSASAVSPMFSLLDKVVGGFGDLIKGFTEGDEEDIIDAVKDLGSATAQVTGVPEAGPRRTFQGIFDLVTGETDDLRRLFWSEYALGEEETKMSKAEKLDEELKDLPKEEANKRLDELQVEDEELYKKVIKAAKDRVAGVTDEDKKAQRLTIGSGERAAYIAAQVEQLETSEEKNAYIDHLKEIDVINMDGSGDEIMKQLKDIHEAGGIEVELKMGAKYKWQELGMTQKEYVETREFKDLVDDYWDAFNTDSGNAWKALLTKEKLEVVKGELVELQRFYGIEFYEEGGSQEYKKELMEEQGLSWDDAGDYKLEHILPRICGGGNEPSNLYIETNAKHDSYSPLEVDAGMAVIEGRLTKKEAEKLFTDLKVNKTITLKEAKAFIDSKETE